MECAEKGSVSPELLVRADSKPDSQEQSRNASKQLEDSIIYVANRPRFGCYSQARTLVHSYSSAVQGLFREAGPAECDGMDRTIGRSYLLCLSICSSPR